MLSYKWSEIRTGAEEGYGTSILEDTKTSTLYGPEPSGVNLSCFEQELGLDDLKKCLPPDVIICSVNLILQAHMPDSCQFFYMTVYDSSFTSIRKVVQVCKYLQTKALLWV